MHEHKILSQPSIIIIAVGVLVLGVLKTGCDTVIRYTESHNALVTKAIQAGKSPLEAKCATMSSPGEDRACLLIASRARVSL